MTLDSEMRKREDDDGGEENVEHFKRGLPHASTLVGAQCHGNDFSIAFGFSLKSEANVTHLKKTRTGLVTAVSGYESLA